MLYASDYNSDYDFIASENQPLQDQERPLDWITITRLSNINVIFKF